VFPRSHTWRRSWAHHERLDGSGYHRGVGRGELDDLALTLATADAWDGARHDRAHRPAHAPEVATALLQAGADAGHLDHRVLAAVLEVAGQQVEQRPVAHPAGLTDREVEVLALLATGRSNKQVARELGIAPKTVGRHVENIYAKAEVCTRAGAVLFAMTHGITGPEVSPGLG
jgi:DNA-binding CsgD family transcriptional regulator